MHPNFFNMLRKQFPIYCYKREAVFALLNAIEPVVQDEHLSFAEVEQATACVVEIIRSTAYYKWRSTVETPSPD